MNCLYIIQLLLDAFIISPKSRSIATSPIVLRKRSSSKLRRDTLCIAGRDRSSFPKRPLWEHSLLVQYSCNITWVWSWSSSTWLGSQIPRHSVMGNIDTYNSFQIVQSNHKFYLKSIFDSFMFFGVLISNFKFAISGYSLILTYKQKIKDFSDYFSFSLVTR